MEPSVFPLELLALSVPRPNIRAIFRPDPGWVIIDADLSGADAAVVAWETEDHDLKESFRTGASLHLATATGFWGDSFLSASGDPKNKQTPKGRLYAEIKGATHGTNYGAGSKTLALNLGWRLSEGARFRSFWFERHPGVSSWHKRVEHALLTTRRASNPFGYRKIYFDRIAGLLPEALAWIPQSTVALTTFYGTRQVDDVFNPKRDHNGVPIPGHPENKVTWLLQVHDSLVFQVREADLELLPAIAKTLEVPIPYPDPLVIPWKLGLSKTSWGECQPFESPKAVA